METNRPQAEEPDLAWYLAAFLIHKWTIAASLIVALSGSLIVSFWQKPTYVARAVLLIEPTLPRVLSNVAEVSDLASGEAARTYYQTQYEILLGDTLLTEVTERAKLSDNVEFLRSIGAVAKNAEPATIPAKIDMAAILRQRLSVELVKDSQLLRISVKDRDRERAAMLANLVAEVYVEQNLTRKLEATRNAAAWLDVQMKDLGTKLEESEMALNKFMQERDLVSVSLEDKKNITALDLETIARNLSETRVKRMEITAQMAEVAKARKDPSAVYSLAAIRNNPQIQALLVRQGERKVELVKAAERLKPEHPAYRQIEAEINAINQLLDQQLAQILNGLAGDARTTEQFEAELDANLEKAKRKAQRLGVNEVDYNHLQRAVETNKNLYTMVMTRLKETSLTGQLETNNARVLERAKVPVKPASPNIPLNIVVALIGGLVAGLALAFYRAFFDVAIKGQQDVEKRLGAVYLGIFPRIESEGEPSRPVLSRLFGGRSKASPDEACEPYVHTHPGSAAAEYCRVIRSNLLFMSLDAPLTRIAVSSSDVGAGKTTTAVSLAILMSQTQGKTLLIDADMRCAKTHRFFGIPNTNGLSSVIASGVTIEDAVRPTEVPGLDLLPAGKVPPQPAELLHSQRFGQLVAELGTRYRFILFDTPPLMGLTDTMIVARHVQGVVLVARWRKTSADFLRRAQQQLTDIGARTLGVVVNDVNLEDRAYYYYQYGHYHRYGSYSYAKSGT